MNLLRESGVHLVTDSRDLAPNDLFLLRKTLYGNRLLGSNVD